MKKFFVLMLVNTLLSSSALALDLSRSLSEKKPADSYQSLSKQDKNFKFSDAAQIQSSAKRRTKRGQTKKTSAKSDNSFYIPKNQTRQKGSFSSQEIAGMQNMLKFQLPLGISALSDLPNDIAPLLSSPDVKLQSPQNKPSPYAIALTGEPLNEKGIKLLYDVVSKIKQKVAPLEQKQQEEKNEYEKRRLSEKAKRRNKIQVEKNNFPKRFQTDRYAREKLKRTQLIASQMAELEAETFERKSKEKSERNVVGETKQDVAEKENQEKTNWEILKHIQQIVQERFGKTAEQEDDYESYNDVEEFEYDVSDSECSEDACSQFDERAIDEQTFEKTQLNKENPKNETESYSPSGRRLLAQRKAKEKAAQKAREKKKNTISEIPQWDPSKVLRQTREYNEGAFVRRKAKSSVSRQVVAFPRRVRRGSAGGISRSVPKSSVKRQEKKVAPADTPADNDTQRSDVSEKNIEEDTKMIAKYLSDRPDLHPDVPRGIR